ncbi:hypothetical protein HAX54_009309, partial [Datura stramonium]|nr:hypothetical protein [Datura stramonium]
YMNLDMYTKVVDEFPNIHCINNFPVDVPPGLSIGSVIRLMCWAVVDYFDGDVALVSHIVESVFSVRLQPCKQDIVAVGYPYFQKKWSENVSIYIQASSRGDRITITGAPSDPPKPLHFGGSEACASF